MKNLIKLTIVLIIGILFVACDDPTSREENNQTTDLIDYCQTTAQVGFIEYYKKPALGHLGRIPFMEIFEFFYVDSNHTSSTFDTLTGLDISFKYGFRYKIKAKQDLCVGDASVLFIEKLIEKKFSPLPFNTFHKLKYFKAENIQNNEYKILNDLNVKILDDNIKTKFDDIIRRSDVLDFRSDNNESFRLYFEFDYNEANKTINFIKLTKIIEEY